VQTLRHAFAAAALLTAVPLAPGAADHGVTHPARILTLEGARVALDAAVALARERGVGGAVAVVDTGGHLVAFERLDGTFAAGAQVSLGKARTSALFKKPTRVFEQIVNEGRTTMLAIEGFTPLQGGVPLVVGEDVVGAIGVSGASSAQEDEELALAGAAALAATETKVGGLEPMLIPAETVSSAFAEGRTLFAGEGLTINASRRDGPGEAEVHEADLDVFYVLSGHALLVTGGEVIDARRESGGELRGSALRGGEVRHLRAGDVAVIPAGTPHWFQQVLDPVIYYVVKSS